MASFRYNTLAFLNKILNGLDLNPVSTIGETEDSEQILAIIDRAYVELDLDINWFPRRTVVSPSTASGTTTSDWHGNYPDVPWAMALPTGVEAVYKVYYNGKKINYLPPEEMFRRIENSNANKIDGDPQWWTLGLMDQDYLYFDSFDQSVESQLSTANIEVYVTKYSTDLIEADADALNMSEKYYNALLLRCLMYGFYEIIHDTARGDRYEKLAAIAKTKTVKNSRRAKIKNPHPGGIFFPHKTKSGYYITTSEYTDASA